MSTEKQAADELPAGSGTPSDSPPVPIDAIRPEDLSPELVADAKTASEQAELQAELELGKKRAELEDLRQETALRKEYADKTFRLTRVWLGGIVGLLLLEGFGAVRGVFDLPDNVLIAAIGGTTVTVTGLFIVVVRYLFPASSGSKAVDSPEK